MINLCLDIGNSRIKMGCFQNSTLLMADSVPSALTLNHFKLWHDAFNFDHIIISSVRNIDQKLIAKLSDQYDVIIASNEMDLPIAIAYKTPETLGIDRICGAIGAQHLFPNTPTLSIDAGTCITYDLVDQLGVYHGGAISPGIQMRLDAMHHFTGKLPQLKFQQSAVTIGTSTSSSMQIGAGRSATFEMKGFIGDFSKTYQNLRVIITGGDAPYFEQQFENTIFAAQNLVLIGLDKILTYTRNKNE